MQCKRLGCARAMGIVGALAGWMVLLTALMSPTAQAARVDQVVPQGTVATVRQVQLRFDSDVVAAGAASDPRAPAPFTLQCNGSAPAGDGRWLDARRWVFDLRDTLPAGQRCTLQVVPAFTPLQGTLAGATSFSFATGGPAVVDVEPYNGAEIDEDQQFLLRLNGPVNAESVRRHAWCEADGLGERIPVVLADAAGRDALLRALKRGTATARGSDTLLLLGCQRPFAAGTAVRLVWGAGITAAGQPQLRTAGAQRFQWTVRPRFLAEFSCERENARAPCLPLRPVWLRFNSPVPRAVALSARLQPLPATPGGAPVPALLPLADANAASATVAEVRFAAPLPENTRFQLTLPAGVRDETGRALSNAGSFPLTVATGGMPPLAKFASAPFGVVEAGTGPEAPAMLPLTLRHVQADLQGASTAGQVRIKRLSPDASDETLLRWIARLRADAADPYKTRALPMLAAEPDATRAALPQLLTTTPRATEVIGVPLPQRGYHLVEVESRVLGHALLAQKAPMYARTGVLVTNLGVHFKRGRSSGLVWVTSLDRGRPVAGARVVVNDCRGKPLWNGSTDAQGIARIDRGFDDEPDAGEAPDTPPGRGAPRCATSDGLFVTARTSDDLGFVFSRWNRGIEPWRFDIASSQGVQADRRAHTVFDRTLLRTGETVSMKHFVRNDTERGLALPDAAQLPTEVLLTHRGSDTTVRLPLAWPRGARSAESRWAIPRHAALGLYDVALQRDGQQLASGSFRIEAFRVPLVDARLSGPAGVLVAPPSIQLAAQVNAMAGGPMAGLPLKLSALQRPAFVQWPGHADFSFQPPSDDRGRDAPDAADNPTDGPSGDGSVLVADKLAATTSAQGAATVALPKLPALKGPADLQAELSFNDPNGEVQTVSQTLRLWPAAVVVGLRVPSWAASRGSVRFTAVVLGTDGQPLKGRRVEVVGRAHQVISTRQRIVGGFYAYDNRRTTQDLGTLCSGSTDAQGRLACDAALQVSGEVELIAQAQDDAGRTAQAAATAWLASGEAWWFAQGNDDRIDLLPEQRSVAPGQTARLQVRMPFAQATALVTVEREGVIDARVVSLSGQSPVIELPIPKQDAKTGQPGWAPNVVVSAFVLRGRLRDAPWWSFFSWGWREPASWWQAFRYEGREWRAPTAMVDLAKPSFRIGAAMLQVGLDDHRLDVKVVPQTTQARVREVVKTTVSVTRGGQPLAGAEVAFAAVDEGLLALQANSSWDLLQALMQPRPWGVETATAQGEIIGRRHYGRKALPPGGGGGRNPTRELFDTLLLWRGTVVLDARGQAVIDVPMNDSLTSFRLVAVADAGADLFGTGSAVVRVTQDLQMLSGLPPLARAGDRFDAGFTLRNTTARAMRVRATLAGSAQGATLAAQPAPQTVQLAAGAAADVRWTVQVPDGATRIDWEGSAVEVGGSAPAQDRLKVVQAITPVVPVRVQQATLQALDGTLSLPVAPPSAAVPGSARLSVALQPTLSGALPGLRRYFEGYPYSCLEQKASRAIGLRDAAAWATLRDELAGYLDADGLASYFPPAAGSAAAGSDRLTAYLLTTAHEAAWAWPDSTREAMLRGLTAFVDGRIVRRVQSPRADLDVRKLAALDALARHGRMQPRQLGSIAWTPAAWPTSALLDAWSLYSRVTTLPARAARLDEVQRLIRSRMVAGGTTLTFSTEAQDDWWWLMDGPDANAARLLLAASDDPAWRDDAPRILAGTLARQKRGAWLTTTANLWGVLALERFAARVEGGAVSGRSTLQAGTAAQSLDWAAKPAGDVLQLPLPAPTTLVAQHSGGGKPWLTVQTLAAVPLQAPVAAGYRISKSLTAVQRQQPDAWTRGDIVRVRLEVQAQDDMGWVVIDDPVPTGATLLGSGLGRDSALATQGERREGSAWLAYEERAADAWRAYYQWMPRGTQVVEYTLRLNSSGRFSLPPTRVEAMYAPETFGERPNPVLEVRP